MFIFCLTTEEIFFLVLALWFLGFTDIRWRAAELSKRDRALGGVLKSKGGSAVEVGEFWGAEKDQGLEKVGDRDLIGAGLGKGQRGG